MTCTREPASWRDAECWSAAVLAGAGVLAVVLTSLPHSWVPRCLLKVLTGIPCLTCGGSRALRALLAGHMGSAFRLQPLLTLLAFAAVLWMAYAAAGLLLHLPRVRVQTTRREKMLLLTMALVLAVANWVYLIAAGA